MLNYLLPFALLLTSFNLSCATELHFPTFTEGLCRGGKSDSLYRQKFDRERDKIKLYKLKAQEKLYSVAYDLGVERILHGKKTDTPTIPKVIHVIWLGSPFPDIYCEWQQTWKNMDGWEYRLWTDAEVANLDLVNREIYEAAGNYGEKSDILRYELLYQFGGLYVDTDFACFNPDYFEVFHRTLDCYIGIEPIEYRPLRVGNAIIGAAPQHPFILDLVLNLKENYTNQKGHNAIEKSGPGYVTRMVTKYLSDPNDTSSTLTVFPSSFFYPFTKTELTRKFKKNFLSIERDDVMPETSAIHFYNGSWVKNRLKR